MAVEEKREARQSDLQTIARTTFRMDLLRSSVAGMLDAGWRTFALLIVTRYFEAPSSAKALVPAAFMIGLLATPIVLFYLSKFEIRSAKLCAFNYLAAGALFLLSSFGKDALWLFLGCGTLAAALLSQQMPLLVHIYTTNYSASVRGKRVSYAITLSVAISPIFGWFGGLLLENELSNFPILFQIMGASCLLAAICVGKIPSESLQPSRGGNPFAHLSLVRKDPVFGSMLGMWMILGFGNLATQPLQIEYMTHPDYGIQASNTQVVIAVLIIPSIVRIFATTIWGHLFDAFDFFLVRGLASAVLLVSLLTFFFAQTIETLYLGSVGYGIAMAGANVNWSLWVTKFAPEGQESHYMTVHSFMTGIRGIAAPFAGFYIIGLLSIQEWASFGAILVGLSILLLAPIRKMARR